MKVHIDGEYDEETVRAIITALSHHLGESVSLETDRMDGADDTEAAFDDEGVILTDREERIREDIADIAAGGPERGHDKIEQLGKEFVRDRIDMVFDDVQYEDGSFAGYANDDQTPADGMITGVGTIDGRDAFFTANDYTVKAGSLGQQGIEKAIRLSERAVTARAPIVRLIDSTGARLSPDDRDESSSHAGRYTGGKSFFNQCIHSGQVPQIGVLYGPNIAGSAYTPIFCDFLIMVEEISGMAIASPRIVQEVTGEDIDMQQLGGPDVHATQSGSADLVVPDEETAANKVRTLLSYLPQDYQSPLPEKPGTAPSRNPEGLDAVIPENPNEAYDVHDVLERIVDDGSLFELKPRFAPELVTAFGRIDGRPVGIIANQPDHVSGAIFPDSAEKAADFIWKCDAFGIPLIYLCDTPGFMVGSQVERQGVLQKGRKFIYATSNAQVPKFCVITRKAYGAGIYAMCGPSFEPDSTLALPSAELAVMGPDAAVRAMFSDQIAEIDDPAEREAFIEETKELYRKDIRKQASSMQVDELVAASDLRRQLERRIDAYRDKRRIDRDRHHGTVLF
ncbi:acyl-CoA carboxylase subunit beta [Salinadaptatus halalkaliphilus]|uniref:Acyl-CoA carboxylase subunit beta n=1 Tax=Salinadaptatus halalkaliphilus TaxID=2419781 RepID=A0A4S3TRM2_9EURY|nr:acyl-CoA carboxylase subunit beta [Salinadaptatus halalkaliphilus]THE66003.1 acyl-CoA carboxylase subunit beta [Salinadaptatus halalkaliphilus]